MIFGFNTDIKQQDTVYHVQSEARESERLLQTQVFVKGRCIGKRAVPYALVTSEGDDGDPHKEKMLREQHRQVLDAIREGKLDSLLDKRESPETLSGIKELEMEWLNANSVHAGGNLAHGEQSRPPGDLQVTGKSHCHCCLSDRGGRGLESSQRLSTPLLGRLDLVECEDVESRDQPAGRGQVRPQAGEESVRAVATRLDHAEEPVGVSAQEPRRLADADPHVRPQRATCGDRHVR